MGRDYNRPAIVIDVDGTLCDTNSAKKYGSYKDVNPKQSVIDALNEYAKRGWYIIICTARQERTFEGNVGKRTAFMLPVLIEWLNEHHVPFDEIRIDKPWHGHNGFCVDDKTVPTKVFIDKTPDEIQEWLKQRNVE